MIKPSELHCAGAAPQRPTLDRPLDHLMACHRRIEERLATLERVIPHWEGKPDEALEAAKNALRFFDTNGVWHTQDEELSLFPRLAGRLTAEEEQFLSSLEAQHVVAEAAYQDVKEAVERMAAGPVTAEAASRYVEACGRLCAVYREHIAAEDARLPEMGYRLLPAEALEEIAKEMKGRRGLP